MARGKSSGLVSRIRGGVSGFLFGNSSHYYSILVNVVLITVIGLVMVLSSSSIDSIAAGGNGFSVFLTQLLAASAGFLAMIAVSRPRPERNQVYIRGAWIFAFVLQLGTVFIFGYSVNGNKNWLKVGPLTFQPSELIKLTLILFIADWFARNEHLQGSFLYFREPLVAGVLSLGAVLVGKDLGTGIIIFVILLGLLIFAKLPWGSVVVILAVAALGLQILLNQGGSRMGRINAWLHKDWPDPNQYNWQQDKATWAFASGGPFGTGLGKSQLKWSWLPESENDFIFAIIGEELGFLGALAIIALFVWLTRVLLVSAESSPSVFNRYILLGLMLWIGVQSTINIMVVVGFAPVLGVPLPFISSGGSSLLMLLTAIGFGLGAIRQDSISSPRRVR